MVLSLFQVKLEQQPQYSSFTMAGAALARAAAMNQGGGVMGGPVNIPGRTGTPLHDIDNQSDAGSERSVTSPFVPGAVSNQPHPAHVNAHQTQHSAFPYHMQHPLIQHLSDLRDFRDVWYGGQHHAAAHQSGQHGDGGANAH